MNIYALAVAFPHEDTVNRILNGRIFEIRQGRTNLEIIFMDAIQDDDLLKIQITSDIISEDGHQRWIQGIDGTMYNLVPIEDLLPTKGIEELECAPYQCFIPAYDLVDGTRRRTKGGDIIRNSRV